MHKSNKRAAGAAAVYGVAAVYAGVTADGHRHAA
jgi:hypothetical protein